MFSDIKSSSALGLITLLQLHGIGPQSAERLSNRFATLGDIYKDTTNQFEKLHSGRMNPWRRDDVAWHDAYRSAKIIVEQAENLSVKILTVTDDSYPVHLRAIHDRPPVLYLKGCLRPGKRYVACIGTREPSHFGEEVTRKVVSALVERGWNIVSGLALGTDSLAHKATLDCHGHTVAVLANGLDSVYPKKNAPLAEDILATGGALLSEQPFGAPAIPRNLVQRDRLQSGMSAATVVMQTDINGGSMHTVRFALTQGRLVFAPIPQGKHSLESKSRGIIALTQKSGTELADLLHVQGEYGTLLRNKYAVGPVAVGIGSRDDYDKMFMLLEDFISGTYGKGSDKRNPQLDLF